MIKIDMTGKTALVIGGARGIGAAVCSGLMSNGCDVACTHLGGEKDDAGAAELSAFSGRLNINVIAGPVEATAFGNILTQARVMNTVWPDIEGWNLLLFELYT